MKAIIGLCFIALSPLAAAQKQHDSIRTETLGEIVIHSGRLSDVERLPRVQGTRLWSGKKNEVIHLQNLNMNVAEKTPRQIFAKVPGVFVYDMDGSGNQMNISTRGLDPHRGWEFNIRANGIITNSDMYGYPASHYSMPMEAVESIELVRGTGSLQYGAQFGGMLNYVTKKPDTTRAISFESINSAGSFGMLSTYNAAGGRVGKLQYYAYYNKRKSDGYRHNSRTEYDAESVVLIYQPRRDLTLKGEVSRSNYIYRIPGPLTDSMFRADPKQSTRSRNYFNPEIYVPSFSVDWRINERTWLSWNVSAVLGNRNSVQFDKPANVADMIDPATLTYAPRQVDIDQFNSYTSELRLLRQYALGKIRGVLAGGIQVIHNDLHRRQLGKGTTGTDFDLSLTTPGWGRDLHFKTRNVAMFVENRLDLNSKLSISPGLRIEAGKSDMTGTITYYDPGDLPNTVSHRFPLFGVNMDYATGNSGSFYAGWAQSYRPVIFKDIIPAATYEMADKNLEDAFGYNLEAGYRGSRKALRWDISLFRLQYNNRLGSQAIVDPEDGSFSIFRTNIGNSVTNGAEIFMEYHFAVEKETGFSIFTSTAFFDARYQHARLRSGQENVDVSGNKVESVPDIITRNGVTFRHREASISFLYSYTGESYADALNTVAPSSNGAVGLVPSYGLLDINAAWKLSAQLVLRLNVNNATNEKYFTKRPTFYPGPGIWPSDGRGFSITIGIKI